MNFWYHKYPDSGFAHNHHKGWFRVFRFRKGVEIWIGKRVYMVDWYGS